MKSRKGELNMIVKIQRSIFPPGANTMLIYDKRRSVEGQLPLSDEVKALLGGDLKGYFKVKMDSTGLLHIQKRVADQEW